ncbi:MAG: hypothetical protein Q7K34_04665 [archaeon]|nr:hypothetical protein [archaeon]
MVLLKKIYFKAGLRSEWFFYFLSGFFFALLGIAVAKIIFAQNIGMVAVFLASLASISIVDSKISLSEIVLGRTRRMPNRAIVMEEIITAEHRVTLKGIFADHKNLLATYLAVFLGTMLCFSAVTLALPQSQVEIIFGEQFRVISGNAFSPLGVFTGIITNNFFVLITSFFLALLFEKGTTFIMVWNASVWGAAFAAAAKSPFISLAHDPIASFALIMLVVFPHLVLEAGAYFSSTIAGGLLNKAIIAENMNSIRFRVIATHSVLLFLLGLIFLGAGAIVETAVIGAIA